VALDVDVTAGVTYLESLGKFDEIIVGRGQLNHGAQAYIWRDLPGIAATPQVVVVEWPVHRPASPSDSVGFIVGRGRLLMRKAGVVELNAWLRSGGRLPSLEPDSAAQAFTRSGGV
jgi:hypothetical protein